MFSPGRAHQGCSTRIIVLITRLDRTGTPKYDEDGIPRSNKCLVIQSDPYSWWRYVRSPPSTSIPPRTHRSPDSNTVHHIYWCAGMYKGGQFKFTFNINPNYPHEPPKVLCTQKVHIHKHCLFSSLSATLRDWTSDVMVNRIEADVKIYHPNLDLSGNICLYVFPFVKYQWWKCW